jgi:hypothetical protein
MRICLCVLLGAVALSAQEPKPVIPSKAAPGKSQPQPSPPAPEPPATHALTVTPAAAPVPALKVMFQPSLKDAIPGNPVLVYLKTFMEQDMMYANKDVAEEREKLLSMPFDELKTAPMKYSSPLHRYGANNYTNYPRRATRMQPPDWNIVGEMQENGYYTLLPEIQKLRALAAVVALRTRGEIMEGQFDEAVTDITVLLTLAKNLGEHPTYIGTLVGLAIAHMGLDRVEEMIQQAKGPNLYWALSTLPQPLVRQERAMLGDLAMSSIGLRHLSDPTVVWGKKEIQESKEFMSLVGSYDRYPPERRAEIDQWLKSRTKDDEWLKRARLDLVSPDRAAGQLEKFPPEQVVFLAVMSRAAIQQQEALKLAILPFHQVADQVAALEPTPKSGPEETLHLAFGSWVRLPRASQAKCEQRIALLRGVEAVRLYAAAHGGQLPQDLKATGVPVPVDPATGGPIRYELTDGKAIIRGTPPKGMEQDKGWNLVYEVNVRK